MVLFLLIELRLYVSFCLFYPFYLSLFCLCRRLVLYFLNIFFHNWHQSGSDYYLQTLALANFLVITGDSVSMISESLSTGKPVYIFSHPQIITSKHNLFHQQLQQENLAQILLPNHTTLTKYSYSALNEAQRLSKIIFH